MSIALVGLVFIAACLHASWNLAAHSQRSNTSFFFQLTLIAGLLGLAPTACFQLTQAPLPGAIWVLLAATGISQTVYYVGLSMGYRHGDFTTVYPLVRALPVLILAFVDVLRGHAPSPVGWVGLVMVFSGCVLAPQVSLRGFSLARYRTRATVWIFVVALGTVGYTTIDKMAMDLLPAGPQSAVRYGALEYMAVVPFMWLIQRWVNRGSHSPAHAGQRGASWLKTWRWPAFAGAFMVAGYWLVLWAYQLTAQTSYVAALRQMSLVIGAIAGVALFHEPGGRLRIGAAGLISLGVLVIAVGG